MSDHIDKLRAKYPELGNAYFAEMERHALRGGIAFLIGYHGPEGAVPVEKLQALLNPTESEGR